MESAGARICREAGGRVVANALLRDFDLAAPDPRLEILADGLHLLGGAQLAVDTTLVSALHCDGSAHSHAANIDGTVLVGARRRKERANPSRADQPTEQSSVGCPRRRGGRKVRNPDIS